MDKKFTTEFMYKHWSTGKSFTFKNKKYRVGKMSYGDYFFEPANWKGKETEGFASNTIWLEKQDKNFVIVKDDFASKKSRMKKVS